MAMLLTEARPSTISTGQPEVEQIILSHGWRGMNRLARHLPSNYCELAAGALWTAKARVMVLTGFHVAAAGRPETDGPPGAFALGRGLALRGSDVAFVAEQPTLRILGGLAGALWPRACPVPSFLPFPVMAREASAVYAAEMVAACRPTAIVSIERCGPSSGGRYINMRGQDISAHTARLDELLSADALRACGKRRPLTVGIGDGGNELGMGLVAETVRSDLQVPEPCITPVDHLVVATVTNWGAYGLLAYLGRMAGPDETPLLPAPEEAARMVERTVRLGAVHAMTGLPEPWVDGFPPETEAEVLARLRVAI